MINTSFYRISDELNYKVRGWKHVGETRATGDPIKPQLSCQIEKLNFQFRLFREGLVSQPSFVSRDIP